MSLPRVAGALAPVAALPMLVATAGLEPADAPEGVFSLTGAASQGGLLKGLAPAGTVSLLLDGKTVPLAPDGHFIVAFDRDHGRSARLEARLPGGEVMVRTLEVAPRAWRIERINISRRPGGASDDYRRRREAELARIAAARAQPIQSEGWRQNFIWPASGRITGVFGSQRVFRGEPAAFHSGVDVAAGAGAPVLAPADGVVVLAGPPMFSLEGNLVIIAHGMGLNSAFLHLKESNVREGQVVKQGQLIGRVGATGRATGPHLHWSMKWREARIDPQELAGSMRNGG